MTGYRFTNKAVVDLSDIWKYTRDTWSEKQADQYYLMLVDCCKTLAQKPETGKKYNEVHSAILGYRANQHIIFYRILQGNEIEIVRILHNRMDLKNRIND